MLFSAFRIEEKETAKEHISLVIGTIFNKKNISSNKILNSATMFAPIFLQ